MNERHSNRALRAHSLWLALSLYALMVGAGCAAGADLDGTEPGLVTSAIGNGEAADPDDEEDFGLVYMPRCSGAALNDRWIISAAHCPAQIGDQVFFLGASYTLQNVIRHPDFTGTGGHDHDIMLAQTDRSLTFTDGSIWFQPSGSILNVSYPDRASVIAQNFVDMLCLGQSTGTYNRGWFTAIRATSAHMIETTGVANGTQTFDPGDSGGPCLRFDSDDHEDLDNPILTAVIARDNGMDPDGSLGDGQAVAITQSLHDWIVSNMD